MAAGIPTHVTLLPPTEISQDSMARIEAHLLAAARSTAPFQVRLRGTGTFRPVSPVVFVAVAQGIGGFESLERAVRTGPLSVDLGFPYHPHVTVAQGVPDEALDRAFSELSDFACDFEVTEFHLYVHDDVSGWQPARTFTLG